MTETVKVIADIFPATITPRPAEVPAGMKLRAIIAEDRLVVAWSGGRIDGQPVTLSWQAEMVPENTAEATYRGGRVGEYTIGRGPGCSCGAAALKAWNPFEGMDIVVVQRTGLPVSTGVTRYSRA